MTGEFVEAAEAQRIGLYHRVVSPERLETETAELAARLARVPPPASPPPRTPSTARCP